jgi:hypothetical protein
VGLHALHYHWIWKYVEDKVFDIESIRDSEQTADALTMPIPKPKHTRHTREMGITGITQWLSPYAFIISLTESF